MDSALRWICSFVLFGSVLCEFCANKYASVGRCSAADSCCLSQGNCGPCQEIRGVWQGLLGTCVFEPSGQTRTNTAATTLGILTSGKCVAVQSPDGTSSVDSSVIEFRNNTGRMMTTLGPGTATGNGAGTSSTADLPAGPTNFNFDFAFIMRNQSAGNIDLFVDTFLGQRILLGKYAISIEEVACALDSAALCPRGLLLDLALGTTRPPTALPSQGASVLDAEATYVYLHAHQTQRYAPPLEVLGAARFAPGSCLREVRPGETLASIAQSYLLQWQDLFALNAALPDPFAVRPGQVLAVGRHHTVRGPCVANCRRQTDTAGATEYDASCMLAGQCLACDWTNAPQLCGETLYGVATRYGTTWQRVLDMNPQLAAACAGAIAGSGGDGGGCRLAAGDQVCVVPYLRSVVCAQEYRRYPVTDVLGNGWQDLGRYFTCNPIWSTALLADKCCHTPRCRCCTDTAAGGGGAGAATATQCNPALRPVSSCVADPSNPACTADCSCAAGYVPLRTVDPASGAAYTSCLLASQCRRCSAPAQRPPACAECAESF